MATRRRVELRAFRIWQEAGCPDGSSLAHWFQAELELGVVSEEETENALARLDEIAAAVKVEDGPQATVNASVPTSERLPHTAGQNLLSGHVEEIAKGRRSPSGTSEDGERVRGEPQAWAQFGA